MTTTTLNLNALDLVELDRDDQQETAGGLGPIGLAILAYAVKETIEHWDEIEQGFQDNFNPR